MLITNATLVTWERPNRLLPGSAVLIDAGRIRAVGPTRELEARHPDAPRLDAGGQLVFPGGICAHTHFYGAFARGMAIPGDAPADFPQILQKLWWPLDRSLTPEDIRCSALLCLADAIRHGTTTLVDHHASPNCIDGSLDIIADAVRQAGVRAVLCYEVSDRDGEARMKAGIAENLRFAARTGREHDGQLAALFGLHASLTLSDATLDACRAAAPGELGFHTHAAESAADQQDAQAKSGRRVIERFKQHEMLGPRSIAAHCVHVNASEIELLADSRTWVTHQPRSNMNNAVGVAPVERMLSAGIPVCLGNDGFSNAMWEEWKAAYLVHKLHSGDPRSMNGNTVVEMAAYHNARLVSDLLQLETGVIRPGAAADLIFVDYHAPTPLTAGNLPWHMLFGFRSSMVTTTIAAGKVLMKDRQLLTLDEEEIAARSNQLAAQMWKRFEAQQVSP